MNKQARHFAVKEIVAAEGVASQDELRRRLHRRGFRVTQATLSRDMRELGIVRAGGADGPRYVLQPAAELQALRPLVGAEILSITANESIAVINTLPGCAGTVGEYIDQRRNPEIIGTLAGDNTVLVIPRSHKKTVNVLHFLKHILIEGR